MHNRRLNCGFRFLERKQCSSGDMKEQVSSMWSWNREKSTPGREPHAWQLQDEREFAGPQKNPVVQRKVSRLKSRA